MTKTVSLPSVKRLPHYLRLLKKLEAEGVQCVSCTQLAEALSSESIQVRKDLEVTGVVGKPKVGFETTSLIEGIEEFLGWNDIQSAFQVGAGSLGSACLGYEGFSDYGLKVLAAFDIDPAKIGKQIHGKKVFPLAKLPNLVGRMHVNIALLTVPGAAAQDVASFLVKSDIKAILNFTPIKLDLPDEIVVEDVNIAASLAALSNRLAKQIKHKVRRS